jgi:uracil-DNA glycosylase
MSMASSKPIFLVGEAMEENEAKIGKGFVGSSGAELLRMLHDAKVIAFTSADRDFMSKFYRTGDPWCLDAIWELHPEVYRTNVFQQHPPQNKLEWFCGPKAQGLPMFPALVKSGYVRKEFAHELERLGDEILAHDPNLIVCLGNSALWALGGRTGITKLRGTTSVSTYTVSGYKLLCTYHPAAVTRQWELRPTTVADLSKINREKDFPDVRRPACEIWIEPDLQDIETFIQRYIANGCEILSVDIETSGSQVTRIGFAPRRDLAIVIPFHDSRTKSRSYWESAIAERKCWELVRSVLEDQRVKKVFQNGLYDVAFLLRSVGIRTLGAEHDTMLLHHALQPEALKGLAYLGSIYTDHGPWKSERKMVETVKRDQ